MLAYLISLLALALALTSNGQSTSTTSEGIIARFEDKIAGVEAPENQALEHIGQGLTNEELADEASSQELETPNTDKVPAYNTQSEREVGGVPQVAVDNADPLVPCTEELCPSPTPTPADPPSFVPPPVPVPLPDPEPIPDPISPTLPCDNIGGKPPYSLIGCL